MEEREIGFDGFEISPLDLIDYYLGEVAGDFETGFASDGGD